MDKNKNGSACNIKIGKDNCKKDRTIFKNCYNKKKTRNNDNTLIQNQQPKDDNVNNKNDINPSVSAYENHRHVIIGPSNVGKTYYM